MKSGVQRFGKFLSAMVMPNIGAFIAWGFITALFIPDGYNCSFAQMGSEEKNKISHRARALQKFKDFIQKIDE